MAEPKVTLAQWKARIAQNAGSNAGATGSQSASDTVPSDNGTHSSKDGKSAASTSSNPLHPDIAEELARVRDTVLVIKRQIYGGSVPGEIGIIKHLQEMDDRLGSISGSIVPILNRLGTLENKFRDLMVLLEIEEEDGKA